MQNPVYKIASSPEEISSAKAIIEHVFAEELGYREIRSDRFDKIATFLLAVADGKPVAALRLVPDTLTGLPIEAHTDITALRNECQRLAEISRLACLKEYRNRHVLRNGFNFFKQSLAEFEVSHLVIESFLHTANFYRALGFVPMGKPFYDYTAVSEEADRTPNSLAMYIRASKLGAAKVSGL